MKKELEKLRLKNEALLKIINEEKTHHLSQSKLVSQRERELEERIIMLEKENIAIRSQLDPKVSSLEN